MAAKSLNPKMFGSKSLILKREFGYNVTKNKKAFNIVAYTTLPLAGRCLQMQKHFCAAYIMAMQGKQILARVTGILP